MTAAPRQQLTLFDTTSIIVGIIIGSSVYKAAPTIAGFVPDAVALLLVWLVGGGLALVGSLCYAELATAWPAEGGDYVYLSRAYGRGVGFLFAWAQFFVVRPGSIGAMAFVFAEYAQQLGSLADFPRWLVAAVPIAVLTAINLVGVQAGKWTQNILTAAKLVGLLLVVVIGWTHPLDPAAVVPSAETTTPNWYLAAIYILFAYGGWNDVAYVSAEVRHPQRNILRALILGTLIVTVVYVLINLAFVRALGFAGLQGADAVATQVTRLGLGEAGGTVVSLLVCTSALGAINGMLFTGARIYSAWGRERTWLSWLGIWSARFGTPVASLVAQGLVTLAVVIGWGAFTDNGFDSLVRFTVPVFWAFLFLVGLAVLILRLRFPAQPRPFRLPGYPWTLLVFCGSSLFMVYASVAYAAAQRSPEERWALGLVAAGVVAAVIDGLARRSAA